MKTKQIARLLKLEIESLEKGDLFIAAFYHNERLKILDTIQV